MNMSECKLKHEEASYETTFHTAGLLLILITALMLFSCKDVYASETADTAAVEENTENAEITEETADTGNAEKEHDSGEVLEAEELNGQSEAAEAQEAPDTQEPPGAFGEGGPSAEGMPPGGDSVSGNFMPRGDFPSDFHGMAGGQGMPGGPGMPGGQGMGQEMMNGASDTAGETSNVTASDYIYTAVSAAVLIAGIIFAAAFRRRRY